MNGNWTDVLEIVIILLGLDRGLRLPPYDFCPHPPLPQTFKIPQIAPLPRATLTESDRIRQWDSVGVASGRGPPNQLTAQVPPTLNHIHEHAPDCYRIIQKWSRCPQAWTPIYTSPCLKLHWVIGSPYLVTGLSRQRNGKEKRLVPHQGQIWSSPSNQTPSYLPIAEVKN